MHSVPDELLIRLKLHGQDHLVAAWEILDASGRQGLLEQLEFIDLAILQQLYLARDARQELPPAEHIAPIPTEHVAAIDAQTTRLGEHALLRGEVAVLLVAGGQGTRLGFDKPKGMYPIGPVSGKSLFQIHAEKVRAIRRRYGRQVPLLIMTSAATHNDTEAYFQANHFFGLPSNEVIFFQQGTMPAIDLETGRLLLEKPGMIFTSPDGHGGTLGALRRAGLFEMLEAIGIRHIFYFQVDNPLVNIADPAFVGRHVAARSQASSKVIGKLHAAEKMGVFALVAGKCTIIEYSDMPKELQSATDARGQLLHRAGSPAIHLFDVAFLKSMAEDSSALPFHLAKKKVPHVTTEGKRIEPQKENALKFERFIFDILPRAERWLVIEAERANEFAPVKNAKGDDSPESAQRALSNQAAEWLELAGLKVARDDKGNAGVPLEVSPLFALNSAELAGRVPSRRSIQQATYFE